jgi:hypothetical protein
VFDHYDVILGNFEDMMHGLDFNLLGLSIVDLTSSDFCFSEEEVWKVISAMLARKVPRPDSFTSMFFQAHGQSLNMTSCMLSIPSGHWTLGVSTLSTKHAWFCYARRRQWMSRITCPLN